MNPLDTSKVGKARLRNFQNILYRAIGDAHLNVPVPSRAFDSLLKNDVLRRVIDGVQGYSINNISSVHEHGIDKPVKVVAFTVHLIGIWGYDITEEHLRGGRKANELVSKFKITHEALARAMCSRGGRSVCNGHICSDEGHQIFFPSPREARAQGVDYQLPLVLGIRQHVYTTRATATEDEVRAVAHQVFRASSWNDDEDHGCYVYHLVSEGSLSEQAGGPMFLAENSEAIRYVSRIQIPCVERESGCFILNGKDRVPRQLVQGPTSQVCVRPEPNEWKYGTASAAKVYGHKASVRRHGGDMDAMMVATVFVTDTAHNGGSHPMNRHPLDNNDSKRGIWVGATWMARRNRKGNVKSTVVPLPLLFMALGITDDRTLMHYCGYRAAVFEEQQMSIMQSIETARNMLETCTHISQDRVLAERARIFFVENAARLNKHQRFDPDDHDAMVYFFFEEIVPRIIDGLEDYDNLIRLATLQNMATRVVRCTSDLLLAQRQPTYERKYVPPDPNHWAELSVYGIDTFIKQELRKGIRRAMGSQTREVGKKLLLSNWDTRNMNHAFKFGGGTNSIRTFLVKEMQVGRRSIKGLSIPATDSSLQVMSNTMTLLKEGGREASESTRALHNTAYGLVSPSETPEGDQVGLVNKMAIGAVVSPEPPEGITQLVRSILVCNDNFIAVEDIQAPQVMTSEEIRTWKQETGKRLSFNSPVVVSMYNDDNVTRPMNCEVGYILSHPKIIRVSWNGIVMGMTHDPGSLIRDLREARRRCHAVRYMSAAFYHDEVVIQTNFGRLGRWAVVLDHNGMVPLPKAYSKLLLGSFAHFNVLTLDRLLDLGVVEFISAMEAESIKLLRGAPKIVPVEIKPDQPIVENPDWLDEWRVQETMRLEKTKEQQIERLFRARDAGNADEESAAINTINQLDQSLVAVAKRQPQPIAFDTVLPTRVVHDGRWVCVVHLDTHMDPHPELLLGLAAAVPGFAGFNQSARESIQCLHVTKSVSHPPPGFFETRSFTSQMVRDKVSRNIVETPIGAWAAMPGQTMKAMLVNSESAWCSEDATTEDMATNDLDEDARLSSVYCFTRTIDARHKMPATDSHGRLILAFPGQMDEGEKVRAMHMRNKYEPGFGGFSESDDELIQFEGLARRREPVFDKIGADGLPLVGTRIFPGDVVMGLVLVQSTTSLTEDGQTTHEICYVEKSIVWTKPFPVVVKSVVLASRPDDRCVVRVKLMEYLLTEEHGNKSSVPAGQKGVISHMHNVGDEYYIQHTDRRYAGIRVSRGYGPSGFKRMTMALQWIMCLVWLALSRREVVRGTFGECHMTNEDLVEIRRLLRTEANLPPDCTFTVTNPATGQRLDARMFCGFVPEWKMPRIGKRMCRAMNRGRRDIITGQPIKGENGGLRFGEMEMGATIAHGVSCVARDRMFWSSDPYQIIVCGNCGLPASGKKDKMFCGHCSDNQNTVAVQIPKSFKVMSQELASAGVGVHIMT